METTIQILSCERLDANPPAGEHVYSVKAIVEWTRINFTIIAPNAEAALAAFNQRMESHYANRSNH